MAVPHQNLLRGAKAAQNPLIVANLTPRFKLPEFTFDIRTQALVFGFVLALFALFTLLAVYLSGAGGRDRLATGSDVDRFWLGWIFWDCSNRHCRCLAGILGNEDAVYRICTTHDRVWDIVLGA